VVPPPISVAVVAAALPIAELAGYWLLRRDAAPWLAVQGFERGHDGLNVGLHHAPRWSRRSARTLPRSAPTNERRGPLPMGERCAGAP